MWRLLFLFSAVLIAAVLIARWWFGMRVLLTDGKRVCRCDLGKWMPTQDDTAVIHRAEETAGEFGRQLRLKALEEWKDLDPKRAASRESSRRFGMAVPPLSGVVALMAVLVAKIPIFGALAAFLAATSLSAILGVMSLAPELQAIMAASRKLRENKIFPNRDDEEAVIRCAIAHAWKDALPPVLQMLQR